MLDHYKKEHAFKNSQFILMNDHGVVLESDQGLFKVQPGQPILRLHPFFESLPSPAEIDTEGFNFYCVHLSIHGRACIADIKLLKKPEGVLLIIYDRTENYNAYQSVTQARNESVIKTELTVLKNRELEERERFKNRFIQNFSHELRNPLTSILALTNILSETELTQEQSKMLTFLKDANSNLRLMLEDTLSIGMIDAGKLQLRSKRFDLKALFELMQFTYSTKAKKKGLDFDSVWDVRIPDMLEGDRLRLFQVITNLLDNAIKYTENGRVTFEIQLNQKRANIANLRFSVSDSGPGIPAERHELVFESFHRERSAENNAGTGLGLTIVKRLLELMNSKIRLRSETGKGAEFYFDLRLKYPLPSEAKAPKPLRKNVADATKRNERKYKVLLVEDDEFVQITLFKILLNTDQFQIDLAYDGALVLQEIVNNDYDLILMDVDLPNLDGIQITRLIRDFPFNNIKNLPIIGLTANAYQENLDACLSAGMQKVLTKPFETEALLQTIFTHVK